MQIDRDLTPAEVDEARRRRITAMGLQVIEDNPLTADDIGMFEMFERERWSHAKRRQYILDSIRQRLPLAAE